MTMKLTAALLLTAVVLGRAEAPPSRLFVFARDAGGSPVSDLTLSDFDMKEGGVPCRVVSVRHGDAPLRVVVLIDNSDATMGVLGALRSGVHALVDRLPPGAEVALVTVGGGYSLHLAPTADRNRVSGSVNSIYGEAGTGTQVARSLLEADARLFRDAAARWPIVVIVATDAAENTTMVKQVDFDALADRLRTTAATVHAVLLTGGGGNSGSARVLDTMSKNLTGNTGGLYQEVTSARDLASALGATAARITADWQRMAAGYEVEYETAGRADGSLEVGTSRQGVTLVPSLRRLP